MTDEVKRYVEICREWYQAFTNFGRGDERSVKDLLVIGNMIESLAAELERVKLERDAAVEDISRECHKCKHFKVLFNGCTPDYDCDYSDVCRDNDHWQWRGVKEDSK